jgi:hypothetical protein
VAVEMHFSSDSADILKIQVSKQQLTPIRSRFRSLVHAVQAWESLVLVPIIQLKSSKHRDMQDCRTEALFGGRLPQHPFEAGEDANRLNMMVIIMSSSLSQDLSMVSVLSIIHHVFLLWG